MGPRELGIVLAGVQPVWLLGDLETLATRLDSVQMLFGPHPLRYDPHPYSIWTDVLRERLQAARHLQTGKHDVSGAMLGGTNRQRRGCFQSAAFNYLCSHRSTLGATTLALHQQQLAEVDLASNPADEESEAEYEARMADVEMASEEAEEEDAGPGASTALVDVDLLWEVDRDLDSVCEDLHHEDNEEDDAVSVDLLNPEEPYEDEEDLASLVSDSRSVDLLHPHHSSSRPETLLSQQWL